jgi:hypothetical protein
MALAADATTTPSIRIAAINQLSRDRYSEPLGQLLEQTVLQNDCAPKERIAALNALVALYGQNVRCRRRADAIASRIRAIGVPTGGNPRLRKAILAAVRITTANESRSAIHPPQRRRSDRNGQQL